MTVASVAGSSYESSVANARSATTAALTGSGPVEAKKAYEARANERSLGSERPLQANAACSHSTPAAVSSIMKKYQPSGATSRIAVSASSTASAWSIAVVMLAHSTRSHCIHRRCSRPISPNSTGASKPAKYRAWRWPTRSASPDEINCSVA